MRAALWEGVQLRQSSGTCSSMRQRNVNYSQEVVRLAGHGERGTADSAKASAPNLLLPVLLPSGSRRHQKGPFRTRNRPEFSVLVPKQGLEP